MSQISLCIEISIWHTMADDEFQPYVLNSGGACPHRLF